MNTILIKNGTIVTMNKHREIFIGDILVEDSEIKKIARSIKPTKKPTRTIDASGKFVIPGLIQAHVHLCQILFRGEADDLALLEWLQQKIWPMEASHTAKSLQASARLGLLEMHKLGTTTILDMGTVKHTHAMLEAVEESGMRYFGGKCLMDAKERSGPLYEDTESSLDETEDLINEWRERNELVQYALCPRFAVSCTEEILLSCSDLQKEHGLIVHTHASESLEEIDLIRKLTGLGNIEYFAKLDMLNPKTVIVHGVHMSEEEQNMMVQTRTPLVHCPASNLKLASGIAPIELYVNKKMTVGLGCDGAPCNNAMDPFIEARLCALLQKPKFGPTALPATVSFELATLGGAKVLGIENQVGSLEPGKKADIVLVDRSHPSVYTVADPYSALVYSCTGRDVTDVIINGKIVVRNNEHQLLDEKNVLSDALHWHKKIVGRIKT